ncbi:MAG: 23S rRNA (uracil(1939)-C(5))-methyltransferase RlmD [Bacilli bacterium]|nr:23S rRNA (uracil(1939)-C(5))-methyltransferase RlmD [Bacilli bacterium]
MIEINSLDHNGRGISRLNEKIVFVNNALPNEIVEIKILKDNKRFIEADVDRYIKKSDIRIDSPCPYFEVCGGCDIMHLSYENQLKFKEDKIKNIVDRYLKLNIKINKIVKCDNYLNYRNKVTFQVNQDIGFFKKNTYDIVNIDKCLISDNKINEAIKYLKKLDLKNIKNITCRVGLNELMIIIDTTNKNLNIDILKEIADSIYLKINKEYIHVFGNKNIYKMLNDYKFIISPDSFFQINLNTCLKLYNKVKEYVGSNKQVLDLYCGTGSIGIFVSKNNNILGIELNEDAIKDANQNKKINNLDNINFICGDSGKKIHNLNFNPDVIIVDPPRSGLNKETINNILKFKTKEIVYVSCDPMTMVRDLNILKEQYNIIEITPFDMFPNTKHVECVTYLKRK